MEAIQWNELQMMCPFLGQYQNMTLQNNLGVMSKTSAYPEFQHFLLTCCEFQGFHSTVQFHGQEFMSCKSGQTELLGL